MSKKEQELPESQDYTQRIFWPERGLTPPFIGSLPNRVTNHLVKEEPLLAEEEKGKPFLYSRSFIKTVACFCCSPRSRFAETFRANVQEFINTFLSHTPLWQPSNTLPEETKFRDPNFFCDTDDLPTATAPRIFIHGRFNGFPHPGIIETLCILRSDYPSHEIWIGLDHNASTEQMGQIPFMDPQFRASLFVVTGLVDNLILLRAPNPRLVDAQEVDYWWNSLYSISDHLDPEMIVLSRDELAPVKWSQMSVRTFDLYFEDMLEKNHGDIHQSQITEGTISTKRLKEAWNDVRRLLEEMKLSPLI